MPVKTSLLSPNTDCLVDIDFHFPFRCSILKSVIGTMDVETTIIASRDYDTEIDIDAVILEVSVAKHVLVSCTGRKE